MIIIVTAQCISLRNISSGQVVVIIMHGSLIRPHVDREVLRANEDKIRFIPCVPEMLNFEGAGYANTNGIGRFKELNLIMSNRYLGIFIQKLNNMKDSTRLLMGPKLTITPYPHLLRQGDSEGQRRGSLFALLNMQRLF